MSNFGFRFYLGQQWAVVKIKTDGFHADFGAYPYLWIIFRAVLAMNDIQCHH